MKFLKQQTAKPNHLKQGCSVDVFRFQKILHLSKHKDKFIYLFIYLPENGETLHLKIWRSIM